MVENSEPSDVIYTKFSLNDIQLQLNSTDEYFMWLIINIAPLYNHDITGVHRDHLAQLKSDPPLMKFIVDRIFTNEATMRNEKALRNILCLLMPLVQLWASCGDVLLKLTDYFIQRINEQFSVPSKELQLPYLFRSSKCWLQKIQEFRNDSTVSSSKDNSFHMYLKILSVLFRSSPTDEKRLWLQFRGRFCSKFTPRKFGELSETGLQNFCSVMITVAYIVPLDIFEEFFLKICGLTKAVQQVSKDPKKCLIFLKAMFALVSVYQSEGRDLQKLVAVIEQVAHVACKDYTRLSKSSKQQEPGNVLILYVDSIQEVFESSSNFSASEYLLVNPTLSNFLKSYQSDLSYIIKSIYKALLAVRHFGNSQHTYVTPEGQYASLLQSVFENILPIIENQVKSMTPPPETAQIAAMFTYFCHRYPMVVSKFLNHTFVSLFKYFGGGNSINPAMICQFLTCILKDETAVYDDLKHSDKKLHNFILHWWLKCCTYIVPHSSEMNQFTRVVFGQKEVIASFPMLEHMTLNEGMDHELMCRKFFYIVGESYKACSSLEEKSLIKDNFIPLFKDPSNLSRGSGNSFGIAVSCSTSDFSQFLRDHIRQNTSNPFLSHVYRLCGCLVEYCAPLLHKRGDPDSVLPLLIDTLLLPNVAFPKDKFLPGTLTKYSKEQLHCFLKGLAKLDYRIDGCIKRKLKEVIAHYLSNLSLANNPIMNLALDVATNRCENITFEFFIFIVEAVKDEMCLGVSPNIGVHFFNDMMRKVNLPVARKICDCVLKDLFNSYLKFEGVSLKPFKDLIETFFKFLKNNANIDYKKHIILSTCQSIVKDKLAWSQQRVFRLLEYLTQHFPDTMSEMIPFLTKQIEHIEDQRGSGHDMHLRREMKHFVDHIQRNSSLLQSQTA